MIIRANSIRPTAWQICIVLMGLTFMGLGAGIAIDSSSDPASVVIGVGVAIVGLYFAVAGARAGATRTPDGFRAHQIGRPVTASCPDAVRSTESSTWWGAKTFVPVVHPADGSDPYEVTVLAMYGWTPRGRAKADRVARVLESWLSGTLDAGQ